MHPIVILRPAVHSQVLLASLADKEREAASIDALVRRPADEGITDRAALRRFFDSTMIDLVGLYGGH